MVFAAITSHFRKEHSHFPLESASQISIPKPGGQVVSISQSECSVSLSQALVRVRVRAWAWDPGWSRILGLGTLGKGTAPVKLTSPHEVKMAEQRQGKPWESWDSM